MAEPIHDDVKADSSSTPRKGQTWDYWLMSRLIWMLLAMVALAVMFLIFMKVAYR